MTAVNVGGNDAFCPLMIENTFNRIAEINSELSRYYDPPLDRLSHFDIKWVKYDGTTYAMLDHLLVFQIFHMSLAAIK